MNDIHLSPLASERIVSLHAEQICRLHGPTRLRVTDGTVWLTVTGQPEDHLLRPGERFTLQRGRDAVVEGLRGGAGMVVTAPAAPWWPQRVAATLRAGKQRVAEVLP